jgi:hypothetical protein
MEGSENHLKTFVKELSKQGVTYEPFYLSLEEYNDIISQVKNNQNKQIITGARSSNSICVNFCKSG